VTPVSRRVALGRLSAAAACLGLASRAGAAGATAAPSPLVALLHTQAAGDNGVVDEMIESLHRFARERHLTARAVYASDPSNYEPILQLLGEAGAAIVFVTFEEMTEPLKALAPTFPATRFIQLYGDPIVPSIDNLRTVSYETQLSSYLAGVCGGLMSRSERIGYIGGVSIPSLDAGVNALIAGARSVRPELSVNPTFVGSFQDPVKALQIANQMFGGGIDFVVSDSAGSDLGVIEAANARPGRVVSGGARQQFALGPASVAAITLCDFGVSLYQQGSAALRHDWKGGQYSSNLRDGVVDFIPSPLFVKRAPAADVARFHAACPHVARARARIIAGSLHVPFETAL
jgi:basic membrane protein A